MDFEDGFCPPESLSHINIVSVSVIKIWLHWGLIYFVSKSAIFIELLQFFIQLASGSGFIAAIRKTSSAFN